MNYLVLSTKFSKTDSEKIKFSHGTAYISSVLKESGRRVYTLNLDFVDNQIETIENYIKNYDIDCVLTGGTSMAYNQIKNIIKVVKEIDADIITIVGGGLITAKPKFAMEVLEYANFGVIGEGEYTTLELVDALEKSKDFDCIKGIVYKSKDGYVINEVREDINDLDEIPFPDYEGFEYGKLVNEINQVSICTSRSCPYSCTFCFHTCGKTYRRRSLDNVFEELDYLLSLYKFNTVNILDELFVSDKERVKEFCNRIKPYKLKWIANARVDGVNKEILDIMKDAGCVTIFYGLESASNEILKNMNKGITIEQIEHAFELTEQSKIKPTGNFLFGDKNETLDTIKLTIDWYKTHSKYDCTISKLIILPGSALYDYAIDNKIIKNEQKFWEDEFPLINISKMNNTQYDEAYGYFSDAISHKIYTPNHIVAVEKDVKRRGAIISLRCNTCLDEFKIFSDNFTWNIGERYECPTCANPHTIFLYMLYKESLEENLKKYLCHNKIYIYGVGLYLKNLLSVSDVLMHENVILMDGDPVVREKGYKSKSIFDRAILDKIEDCVVINALSEGTDSYNKVNQFLLENTGEKVVVEALNDFLYKFI